MLTATRRTLLVTLGLAVLCMAGCVTVPISATNPIPNLTTVAVVPFFNLSAERTVDGRRFAIAYYGELQKTPGFQVLPVGVVEQAIHENQLSMQSPDDALRLAGILNVDAVVVGAVTEYDPYYPPKLGMQVQWYSPRQWAFYPGAPECPTGASPTGIRPDWLPRAQSPDEPVPDPSPVPVDPDPPFPQLMPPVESLPPAPLRWPGAAVGAEIKPLMAYTRFFDGADPRLTNELCLYLAWRSDRRSGDWEAHLQRSDDFIQFCSHLMVMEMLSQHGAPLATDTLPFWKTLDRP